LEAINVSTGPYQIASDDAMQDAQVVAEVLETLDRYSATDACHDLDGILALFAPGPDIVLLGTGADEKRIGFDQVKQQFERNFDETEASTITWGWRHVAVVGSMAWVAADAVIAARVAGKDMRFSIRMTIVLEHRDGAWLWVHRHASVPAAGQAMGKSYLTRGYTERGDASSR
jgi:uncharacterized protein (TIGR02246 family)